MRLPTFAQLERASHEAHVLLEAYIREAEEIALRAITAKGRAGGRRRLRAADKRWNEWFGEEAASGKAVQP